MNRILAILAALILLGAGGALVATRTGSGLFVPPALADSGTTTSESGDGSTEEAQLAPDYTLGDPEAPITMIEYASFTCPHCARFHDDVFKKLKAEYIDTGKVRFIQREVYFDRFGLWAGMIARCGGEMRYYGISDILFETQQDWIGSGDGNEVLTNLRKIGKTAGMSDDQLGACLEDEALAASMVAAYQTHAEADDIAGTPTFIINGEKYSNMSYDAFAAILDETLAATE